MRVDLQKPGAAEKREIKASAAAHEKRSCSLYGNAPFFMYIICFWYTARSEFNKSGRSCARSLFFLRKNAPLLSSFYLYSYALQICKGHENLESVSRRTETSTGFAIWAFMPDSSAFRRSSSNAFAVMATIGISPRFPGSARIASVA